MAPLSQAGSSDRQEDKDLPQPDENASTEASFTWFDAVALSFAIVAFFFHTLCGAKLLLVYWSTMLAGRFSSSALLSGVLLSSAVLFRGEPRGPRRPVLSHPVPIEFTKLKARSGFILLVPPVWLGQELYYGLKSKWALEEDDEAFYLGLIRDIRPTNHVLRMYQGCEALIYLAMSLCHLGPRSLEPSSLSAFEVLSLLVPSVSYALAHILTVHRSMSSSM